MRRFIGWLRGWAATIDIWWNDHELYRALSQPLDGTDFGEVNPRGETS